MSFIEGNEMEIRVSCNTCANKCKFAGNDDDLCHVWQHPTCETCANAKLYPYRESLRNCTIHPLIWHKDDYCSSYSIKE